MKWKKNIPWKKNITLYVTDLDGTLLNTQDKISPTSLSIINSLIARGMHFTYATARSLVSAKKVTEGLRLDIPVIVYNGAFIMNAEDGNILYSCSFTEEERLYIKELLEEYNTHPLIYTFEEGIERVFWHKEFENDGMKRYLACRSGDKRFWPLELGETLYRGDIFYYTCIGEEEEFLPIYRRLQEDDRFTCTLKQELYRPEYWLEIMPGKATKAEAIKKLQELWECDRTISFGDAVNDIPMFRYSDEAYAVANAVPECKECATDIIGGNDEDGVALWLREHFIDNAAN